MSMIAANSNTLPDAHPLATEDEYVTVMVADQIFGLPIDRVHDVPLAPKEIVGLLNLRGRVVTAMCLRRRLGLPEAESGREMAVGLEHQGESYGVLVDQVGEVMKLSSESREPNPVHMDARWVRLSRGVHRLNGQLLIVLDVDAVLDLDGEARAA
jgi:purine-binding chemotaxis protein CheW